jgi:serine phosphatase RsbU (regulator of sigma subunit)
MYPGGIGVRAARYVLAIVGLVLAISAVRLLTSEAAYGLAFLFAAPVALAAVAFGRTAGLAIAAGCLSLFLAGEVLDDGGLEGGDLVIAAAVRGFVLAAAALLVADVMRRQDRMTRRLALQESEMRELRALREALTPRELPDLPDVELASAFTPAEGIAAGDFHLVSLRDGGSVTLVLGDVVGHGLAAAQRAAFVRVVLATIAKSIGDPVDLLRFANTALIERQGTSDDFVTAVCVCVDASTHTVTWASAGHPHPYELDTGRLISSRAGGPPLGISHEWHAAKHQVALDRGGGLLLYSDGLPEARRAGEPGSPLLGEQAVERLVSELRGHDTAEVVRSLEDAALAFADGRLADDLTLLAFRLHSTPAAMTPETPDAAVTRAA